MTEPLPIVLWMISVFDRKSTSPLPLKNRSYVLDWSALDEGQIIDCLEILKDRMNSLPSPSSFTSTVMSISRDTKMPDDRMLKYRPFFIEHELENTPPEPKRYITVSLNRDYVEDENGSEISMYQIMQHMTGHEYPIIAGDHESVLRLPPVTPIPNSWTAESANTLSQFLEVVELIHASKWIRRVPRLTFEVESGGDPMTLRPSNSEKLLEFLVPDDHDTQSVLSYFRQLHSKKDQLFKKACESFLKTSSDPARNAWVEDQLQGFEQMIASPPIPFGGTHSRKKIIEMFMYGARMLHAESEYGDDKRLSKLIQEQGTHRVACAFANSLWDILCSATTTYHVIKRDYNYWVTECGLTPPTRVAIPDLFKSISAKPKSDD